MKTSGASRRENANAYLSASSGPSEARAGTHNHECRLLSQARAAALPTANFGGYGSLRSQGRQVETPSRFLKSKNSSRSRTTPWRSD